MIEMHEAVEKAIAVIKDVYRNEDISDVELEEIEFDSENWLITVGFTRQKVRKALGGLALPTRTLKVVKIDRRTGAFAGMKIRDPRS
jgi:hypothetical protein